MMFNNLAMLYILCCDEECIVDFMIVVFNIVHTGSRKTFGRLVDARFELTTCKNIHTTTEDPPIIMLVCDIEAHRQTVEYMVK